MDPTLWGRVARLERIVLRLARMEVNMSGDLARLDADVADLTSAESATEGRVTAALAAQQAQIDDLKARIAAGADLGPAIAGIEAATAHLTGLLAPTPAPAEPAPVPADPGTLA